MVAELEELRQVYADISSKENPKLSDEEIENYFQKIILTARSPQTCEPVCWDVGVWLLLLSDNKQDYYFNKYGYDAIRTSIVSAIQEGCLPKGLGWLEVGFVPNDAQGDLMLGVLSNPDIDDALQKILVSQPLQIDLASVDPNDPKAYGVLVRFISHLHRFGLSDDAQLMWAARLVEHMSPQNRIRFDAMKLVLTCLIKTQRFINAFYWLQWLQHNFNKDEGDANYLKEDSVSDVRYPLLLEIIKIIENSQDVSNKTLSIFLQDDELLNTVSTCDRCKLLIMLVIVWLIFIKGKPMNIHTIESVLGDLLWNNFPELSLFIQRLSSWAVNVINRGSISRVGIIPVELLNVTHAREQVIEELRSEMNRNPNYRNRSLPVEIWRDCKENIFLPLLISLETSTNLSDLEEISKEIDELNANSLIDEMISTRPSKSRSQKLEPNSHQMLMRDFEGVINSLNQILSLCTKRFILEELLVILQREINWSDLDKELDSFSEQWPSLQDSINKYLDPILTVFEPIREKTINPNT